MSEFSDSDHREHFLAARLGRPEAVLAWAESDREFLLELAESLEQLIELAPQAAGHFFLPERAAGDAERLRRIAGEEW